MWTYHAPEETQVSAPLKPAVDATADYFTQFEHETPQRQERSKLKEISPQSASNFNETKPSERTNEPKRTSEMHIKKQIYCSQQQRKKNKLAQGLGALYLLGLLFGAVCSRFLSATLLEFANYYASFMLRLYQQSDMALVFSTNFVALFAQMSLFLLMGLCVLGCGLIPIGIFVKGIGTGFFWAFVYSQLGTIKGMFMQSLMLWLPEVIASLLMITLCVAALRVSVGLLQICVGKSVETLSKEAKQLIKSYLLLCLLGAIPCILAAVLSSLFSGLF